MGGQEHECNIKVYLLLNMLKLREGNEENY